MDTKMFRAPSGDGIINPVYKRGAILQVGDNPLQKADDLYPLTLVYDRYGGTYPGGAWICCNLEPFDVPEASQGDDVSCMAFWAGNQLRVGRGETPAEAVAYLLRQIREE